MDKQGKSYNILLLSTIICNCCILHLKIYISFFYRIKINCKKQSKVNRKKHFASLNHYQYYYLKFLIKKRYEKIIILFAGTRSTKSYVLLLGN